MRVLWVDDDELVGGVVGDLLAELGHEVIWAADGIAALDRLAQSGFDLLITDVRLGRGGDGRSLAQLARQERPSLPVIFMTGDDRVTLRAGEQLLRKPCTLGTLEAAINRARASG